ncbi:MAG: PAS domain-containing protein [Kiritimatiellae bacterium]|nr:PAS domain-containing protein [Kiritimatiellia bacterium]
MKSGFFDKLIDRLGKIDPESLQAHFLQLAQEKGLLETIFHAIREGIIVLDGDGGVRYANRAAEELLGVSLAAMARRPISRYLREIDWDRILALDAGEWSRLLTTEIEVTYPEHRFLSLYVVPLPTQETAERGAVVILRDATRERENEASLIESERLNALRLLAAGVAHEIGNPLNSLHIHLQLLDREIKRLPKDAYEKLRELLDVAGKEVARLDVIITQFLRAIRPVKPQFESCQIEDLLDETLTFLKQEITDRGIAVEVERPPRLPTARVDQGQIKQAFFNVIKNALQAMPDGGRLRILMSSSDRHVMIAFEDTGVGIAAGEIGRIFEPYHTTKSEGSGLGLMIVQRIVQDHGGQIDVHSEPNVGTTFTLFLPRFERRIRLLKAHRGK